MNKLFKVLILGYQNGIPNYVDEALLSKGIYPALVPILHGENMTIEKLIQIRKFAFLLGADDDWCTNIRQCQLIYVTLEN